MNYKKDISKDISVIGHSVTNGARLVGNHEGSLRLSDSNETGPVRSREILQRESASNEMISFSITLPKKCERLATAIYLVTNFLSDTEPMKSRLRVLSLDFVRDASLLRNGSRIIEVSVLEALRANIAEVLALLELALVAGIVSEMNFTLLKREYISLRDMIDAKKASHESLTDNVLGDNFFGTPELAAKETLNTESNLRRDLTGSPEGRTLGVAVSSSTSRSVFVSEAKQSSIPAPIQHSTFKVQNSTTRMSDNKTKGHDVSASSSSSLREGTRAEQSSALASHPRATTDDAKESRRARILKLIKDNHEVAIKDIVAYFPDLSEKTIQRELVAMSDSGVLKKSGERRWSRYTLA